MSSSQKSPSTEAFELVRRHLEAAGVEELDVAWTPRWVQAGRAFWALATLGVAAAGLASWSANPDGDGWMLTALASAPAVVTLAFTLFLGRLRVLVTRDRFAVQIPSWRTGDPAAALRRLGSKGLLRLVDQAVAEQRRRGADEVRSKESKREDRMLDELAASVGPSAGEGALTPVDEGGELALAAGGELSEAEPAPVRRPKTERH